MNGVFVTARKHSLTDFVPHFYDAEGDCVEAAYAGNLHNVRVLMDTVYADFARPPQPGPIVCTKHVFPVMFHLFVRAGVAPLPKYLKESVTPVIAAMALGAAKQYGTPVIPCVDLWGPGADWPAHSPEALSSALLFAYWTGSPAVYVENFSYRDSLYQTRSDGTHELTAWGEAVKRFKRKTMPANPRSIQPDERHRVATVAVAARAGARLRPTVCGNTARNWRLDRDGGFPQSRTAQTPGPAAGACGPVALRLWSNRGDLPSGRRWPCRRNPPNPLSGPTNGPPEDEVAKRSVRHNASKRSHFML